jgi:hypothetical protein
MQSALVAVAVILVLTMVLAEAAVLLGVGHWQTQLALLGLVEL